MRRAVALTALLLAGWSAAGAADTRPRDTLEGRLAGLTPGKPQSCLPNSFTSSGSSLKAYGPTLLYIAGRNLVFRNDTGGGCENVARGDILVSIQPTGRACRGDIARTVDPVSRTTTGSCGLGDFTPYRRAK
jgi:hypothetical protein